MAHKAVEMKRSERSDAEIQLSKQVVQTFLNGNAVVDGGETLLRSSSVKAPVQLRSTAQALTFRADGMVRNNTSGALVDNTFDVCIPTTQPADNKRAVTLAGGSRIAVTTPVGTGTCP